MRVSQTVSPLETLTGLYDAIQAHSHTDTQAQAELDKEATIVSLDFEDIAPEPIEGMFVYVGVCVCVFV